MKIFFLKIFDYGIVCIEFCMKSNNFSNEIDELLFCLLEMKNVVKFSLCKFVILMLFLDLIFSLNEKLFYYKLYKIF